MIDYLSHHGVKGMRWGVRKDKAHRQGAMAGYVKVAQRIQDVEKVVDTKSSKAVKLKAGSTLYRTHRGKEGKKLGDHSYFSTNNVDAAQYRGIMPSMREGVGLKKYSKKWVESTYKTISMTHTSMKSRIAVTTPFKTLTMLKVLVNLRLWRWTLMVLFGKSGVRHCLLGTLTSPRRISKHFDNQRRAKRIG